MLTFVKLIIKWIRKKNNKISSIYMLETVFLPPDNIATRITPQDQTSAAVALYGRMRISGAT